jgi:PKD repeat protein
LAYTSLAAFTTNEETVLGRRLDYDANPNSIVLPFAEVAVFSTTGVELDRRTPKKDSGLLSYTTIATFDTVGVSASRIVLPVISEIDTVQIIVRAGTFDVDFVGTPLNGLPPHGVQFTNLSKSPVESYSWDFGDGQTSTEKDPFHIYVGDEDYTVKLTAGSVVYGFASETKVGYVVVGVRMFIVPTSGEAPLKVSFSFDKRQLG